MTKWRSQDVGRTRTLKITYNKYYYNDGTIIIIDTNKIVKTMAS